MRNSLGHLYMLALRHSFVTYVFPAPVVRFFI
jgi:hypothetical protein